jgi:hypothetical protein
MYKNTFESLKSKCTPEAFSTMMSKKIQSQPPNITDASSSSYNYKDTFEISAIENISSGTYKNPNITQSENFNDNVINLGLIPKESTLDFTKPEGSMAVTFLDETVPLEKRINIERAALGIYALLLEQATRNFNIDEIPTTLEGKIEYNKIVSEIAQNPVIQKSAIAMPILSSFNDVEGTNWSIADGAEALAGHDVLTLFEYGNADNKLIADSYKALTDGIGNQTGFTINIPALYYDQSENSTVNYSTHSPFNFAGKTFEPEIKIEDALGLSGMSINERKTFLSRVQNILDGISPDLKSYQLQYSIGNFDLTSQPMIGVSEAFGYSSEYIMNNASTINSALKNDKVLFEMLSKANSSSNKTRDELTISVVDNSGAPLAKNEIIISANGKSMKTTVDTIKNLDHEGILYLIKNNK